MILGFQIFGAYRILFPSQDNSHKVTHMYVAQLLGFINNPQMTVRVLIILKVVFDPHFQTIQQLLIFLAKSNTPHSF
jgi:hypothetical protein